MGYDTAYNLEISDNTKLDTVVGCLKELEVIGYALDENLSCYDPVKWYSRNADMLSVSLKFPEVLFSLNGEGEESGDIWVAYYLDGKTYEDKAIISLPPFNIDKLK